MKERKHSITPLVCNKEKKEKKIEGKNDLLRAYTPTSRLYIPEIHLRELNKSQETER